MLNTRNSSQKQRYNYANQFQQNGLEFQSNIAKHIILVFNCNNNTGLTSHPLSTWTRYKCFIPSRITGNITRGSIWLRHRGVCPKKICKTPIWTPGFFFLKGQISFKWCLFWLKVQNNRKWPLRSQNKSSPDHKYLPEFFQQQPSVLMSRLKRTVLDHHSKRVCS